jgi:hypothetical protein
VEKVRERERIKGRGGDGGERENNAEGEGWEHAFQLLLLSVTTGSQPLLPRRMSVYLLS